MVFSIEKAIKYFESRMGKVTYSMNGSRIGTDGTADCSGMVYKSLIEGGLPKYDRIPSTDFFHDYLLKNGWVLVSENKDFKAKRGQITIWGRIWQSGGSAGHMGMWLDNQTWIECTAWKNGIIKSNHDNRWLDNNKPYFYTYEYSGKLEEDKKVVNNRKRHKVVTGTYGKDSVNLKNLKKYLDSKKLAYSTKVGKDGRVTLTSQSYNQNSKNKYDLEKWLGDRNLDYTVTYNDIGE